MALQNKQITNVWLALIVATLGSFVVAEYLAQPRWGVAAIMIVAAFKVRLILRHFMELKHASTELRVLFDAWILVCAGMISGFYYVA